MPAPTMSHVIFTGALVVMIFATQFFYLQVIDNIWAEMARRELKEIADYVSDTLANLYFLVNSSSLDIEIEKNLDLPSEIRDSTYIVEIIDASGFAQNVSAYLKDRSWIYATSWLLPGLKVDESKRRIESGEKTLIAGCHRVNTDVYVWIEEA
jgi:hypothetical protein